jgi:esterase/lipase superfamily enzyme
MVVNHGLALRSPRSRWRRMAAVLALPLAMALTGCGEAPKQAKKSQAPATETAPSEDGLGRIGQGVPPPVPAPEARPDDDAAMAPGAAPEDPGEASGGEAAGGAAAPQPPPPPPAAAPAPRPYAHTRPRSFSPAPPAGGSAQPGAGDPSGGSGPPAGGATKPGTAVIDEKSDWDVVPVFYGTDRGREADAKRVSYTADRGRRLELGRVLVTVPKAHEVPNIERPWAIKVPYFDVKIYEQAEDPKKHFTMKEVQVLSREQYLAFVRERLATSSRYKDHAIIFVHGYNTAFDSAVFRTAQMAYDLKFDGAAFLYSWPSGGSFESYTYDRESAGQAQPFMRDFLDLVVKETGAKSVSIIAHSMGNQPVLQILRDLKFTKPDNVVISQIILAAPDVDRDNFENIAKEIKGMANGVTLYAASNDRALNASRRFNGGVPRAGDVPPAGPLILSGIDTIDVTAAGMEGLYLNHSSYAENNALLADIGLIIQTGERPPDKRFPLLQKVTTDHGEYWKYPPRR